MKPVTTKETKVNRKQIVQRMNSTDITEIRSIDLRHEAERLHRQDPKMKWEYARYTIEGETQWIDVLFVPSVDRAGVAWGADADWTDAVSLTDAIERYFGVDGKEMVR